MDINNRLLEVSARADNIARRIYSEIVKMLAEEFNFVSNKPSDGTAEDLGTLVLAKTEIISRMFGNLLFTIHLNGMDKKFPIQRMQGMIMEETEKVFEFLKKDNAAIVDKYGLKDGK